jgi:hypothetical protein
VGFVLLFGAAAVVAWRTCGARGLAGAAFTGLLAFSLHLLVDFHLKIPAIAMTVAAVAALVTADAWPSRKVPAGPVRGAQRIRRLPGVALAAVILAGALAWAAPKYRAEEIRRAARERIDKMAESGTDVSRERAPLAAIRADFARAVAMDPSNAQAWSDEAYADSLWGLVEPGRVNEMGVAAAKAGDAAIRLSPVVAEFWIRKGAGLDMQGLWLEGGRCSSRALQIAPGRADTWYYQAYHFSLKPTEYGPAMAAADFSLRLDPGFLLAQALRQRLANR